MKLTMTKILSNNPSLRLWRQIIMLAALSGSLSFPTLSVAQDYLSLSEVISMATKNNQYYHYMKSNIDVATQELSIKRGAQLPKIDLVASYLYSPFEDKRLVPRAALSNVEANNRFSDQIASVGLSASYALYTGGKLSAEEDIAKFSTVKATMDARQTLDDLILQVTQQYYQLNALTNLAEAVRKSSAQLTEALRIVKKEMKVGKAASIDKLKIESRLANVNQTLINIQTSIKKNKILLNSLIVPDNSTEEYDFKIVQIEQPKGTVTKYNQGQLVEQALINRPAIKALKAQIKIQKQKIIVAQSANKPQLKIRANYSINQGNTNYSENIDDANIGLYFSMPLFDGGVITSNTQKTQSQLSRLKFQEQDLVLATKRQVLDSLQNINQAQQSMPNSEMNLSAARESLRIESLKLEVGKGIVNDLLDAQAESLKAEFIAIQAIVDLKIAQAELDRSIGNRSKLNE